MLFSSPVENPLLSWLRRTGIRWCTVTTKWIIIFNYVVWVEGSQLENVPCPLYFTMFEISQNRNQIKAWTQLICCYLLLTHPHREPGNANDRGKLNSRFGAKKANINIFTSGMRVDSCTRDTKDRGSVFCDMTTADSLVRHMSTQSL